MRKILATLVYLAMIVGVFTSCLDSDDELVLTPNVYLESFSINDIETEIPSKTESGKDTTIIKKVYGDSYLFAIDHLNGLVYNVDSLPKGTDVTRVTVNLTLVGGYATYLQGETVKAYSSTDSIDFTSPVRFTLYANDREHAKNYRVCLNVHQADMDSLVWTRIEDNNFHGGRMTAEKMVQLHDHLMVYGEMDGKPTVMAGKLADDFNFAQKEWPLKGIEGTVDYSSIVAYENVVYLLADGKLYSSINSVDWTAESSERTFTSMVGIADGKLYLNEGGVLVACDPEERSASDRVEQLTHDWEVVQAVDESLFPVNPWVVEEPLATNPLVKRTTLVGVPRGYAGKYATVWSKLSIESEWTCYPEIPGNGLACPLLERLTVISYDRQLYAFGGSDNEGTLLPFEAVFASTDGGITWWKQDAEVGLPEELKGYDEPFACVVDTADNIWILCSDGRMFRGNIGRLAE